MNQKFQYLIKKITECDDCRGTGIVTHPAWRDYQNWYDGHRTANYTPSEDEKNRWWMEAGYYLNSRPDRPPEEIDCSTCSGVGKIEEETDLKTALANLGVTTFER